VAVATSGEKKTAVAADSVKRSERTSFLLFGYWTEARRQRIQQAIGKGQWLFVRLRWDGGSIEV
jgi:hypothetical protein